MQVRGVSRSTAETSGDPWTEKQKRKQRGAAADTRATNRELLWEPGGKREVTGIRGVNP